MVGTVIVSGSQPIEIVVLIFGDVVFRIGHRKHIADIIVREFCHIAIGIGIRCASWPPTLERGAASCADR
jgi:hypothetical protein